MIKSLSPYYVITSFLSPLTSEQCTEYKLQLYVWNGAQEDIPASATYEVTILNTDVSAGNSKVNISKLVNDFIDFSTNSDTITNAIDGNNQLWVQHDVIYTTTDPLDLDVQQSITTELLLSGYSYGNEGENAQPPTNKILLSGTEFNMNRGGYFIVPVLASEADYLIIFNAYEERVEDDGGTIAHSDCTIDYIKTLDDYDAASLIMPEGFGTKAGVLYNLKPTDGLGDFTVDRNSLATYIGKDGTRQTAAIDVARNDFSTEPCGVLLTEPQSTNIYLNSDVLVTQGVTTAADEYTVSFKGTGTITFSGTFSGSLVGTGSLDTDIVSLTFTATSGTLTSTVTGTVENAQCENLDYATSWILTAGSSVTRLKDQITGGGTVSDFNSLEGVLFLDLAYLINDATDREITLSDGTSSNRVVMTPRSAINRFRFRFINNGTTYADINFTMPFDITNLNKYALVWSVDGFRIWANGIKQVEDLTITASSGVFSTLDLSTITGTVNLFGKTKQIKVYPTALTDAQLIALTTL